MGDLVKTKILDGRQFTKPREVLTRRRNEQQSQFQKHGSIVLPTDLAKELEDLCGTCGVPLKTVSTRKYFGQIFCLRCVQAMQSGAKP